MRSLAALVVLALTTPAAPPPVRSVTLPRTAVVGSAWQATLRAAKAPTVVATGPADLVVARHANDHIDASGAGQCVGSAGAEDRRRLAEAPGWGSL